jgi:hypothetical protein
VKRILWLVLLCIAPFSAFSQQIYPGPGAAGSIASCVAGVIAGNSGLSAVNAAIIQTALTAGGPVAICTQGIDYVSGTLLVPSSTSLEVRNGAFLTAAAANNLPVVANANWAATSTVVTITSSALVATVAQTAQPYSVGQWVSVLGATQGDYDGVFQVTGTTANTFTYNLDDTPAATTATPVSPITATSETYTPTLATLNMTPGVTLMILLNQPITVSGATPACLNGTFPALPTANTAATVTYAVTCVGSGTATGTITVTPNIYTQPADHDITITGPGTIDYNSANQSVTASINTMNVIMHNVANLTVRDIRLANATKYSVLASNVRNGIYLDISVSNPFSDGVDIRGPIRQFSEKNIFGLSHDDFIGAGLCDYAYYALSCGDVAGLSINDIHPTGISLTDVGLAGANYYRWKSVDMDGLFGQVLNYCFRFIPDSMQANNNADVIHISNIRCDAGSGAFNSVQIGGQSGAGNVSIGLLTIDGITRPAGSTNLIVFNSNATVTDTHILHAIDTPTAAANEIFCNSCTATNIDVRESTFNPFTTTSSSVMSVAGTGAVTSINFDSVTSTPQSASVNPRWLTVASGATALNVHYHNVALTAGHSFLEQLNTASTMNVWWDGTVANATNGFVLVESTNLHLGGGSQTGVTNRFIQSGGSSVGTIEVDGFMPRYASRIVNKAGSASMFVNGATLSVDPIGNQTARAGDTVLDVATTCQATSDGTSWFFAGLCTRALTNAATVTPVMIVGTTNGGNNFTMTLAQATTIANPATIPPAGAVVKFSLLENGTGAFGVTWGTAYQFPVAWSNVGDLANKRTYQTFVSDGTNLWAQGQNSWN